MAIEVTLSTRTQANDADVYALLDGTALGAFLADQNISTSNVTVQVNDRVTPNLSLVLQDGDHVTVATNKHASGL